MFREESLEYTMKAFADFLYQRCGGGSQFTDRRGFVSISELHSQYEISVEMVEKWCDVMEEAMYRMKSDFNEDHRQQILDYLRYQGYEIIVWAKYKKLLKKRGPLFWLYGCHGLWLIIRPHGCLMMKLDDGLSVMLTVFDLWTKRCLVIVKMDCCRDIELN